MVLTKRFVTAGLVAWILSTQSAWAAPYNYPDVPGGGISIPDSSCGTASSVARTINVSDSFFIDDLNVGLVVAHPYRQPVQAILTSPDNTAVTIVTGGDATQNYNVELDSASGNSLNDGLTHDTAATPYQYTRTPSNSLDDFVGEQASGDWTLEICDSDGFNDNGTFLRAELIFEGTVGSGPGIPTGITTPASGTIVNSYAKVNSISGMSLSVSTTSGFAAGGRALIVQMQGAAVNRTDTSTHGDVTGYGTAGRFEYVEIASIGGGTITLAGAPSISFNTAGSVQIVSVPVYSDQTVSGKISSPAWNGNTGGVVAIDDTGTLTLSGDIDVTGLGFAGGPLATSIPYDSCASDQTNYTSATQGGTGNKGHGITVPNASHAARRGHNANGGGGGNITDAGGGGGGNIGAGGIGGRELDLCDGTSGPNYGGVGGQALDYSPNNRLFMGGGAGSGGEMEQAATGGNRSGGGLVFLRADTLTNSGGRILTIGLSSFPDDFNGSDGGAAGGSVAISVISGITGLPIVSVVGGDGGDEANGTYAHGTGGGGGGGAIRLNGAVCSDLNYKVDGGKAGVSSLGTGAGDPNWGAADGGPGNCAGNFTALPVIPNATPTTLAGSKSVAIWDPTSVGLYSVPGNDVIYTITITNEGDGAADANSIALIDNLPSHIEFYNGDIDDSGSETDPVSFTQTGGAGLTFNYASDVAYSNSTSKPATFAECTYVPAAGYDPAVTYVCFNPKGAMSPGDPDPTMSVSFRARIK